ncbi:MAG TPA: acylneuraminate cytidylyltransferase family protein [Bdellovibrionota bacterium]|nr:acylneuraminate cytidylyltransferase family protein [Bdellovibrionota bacterium]
MSKIIALLPMKAHSERVSGKNFRLLNGKPLFRWVLDTMLSVPEISTVVINTDAREILAKNGLVDSERVKIRDRRPEICGDFVSMNKIIADDIEAMPADFYLMTHTTNPLLSAETIREAIRRFSEPKREFDSIFTVNKHQTRFYRKDLSPINHDPNNLVRTQDLEPWYEENSNLYVFTKRSFAATGARIGAKPALLEMRKTESIDIDDAETWDLADAVIRHTHGDKSP